MTAAALFLLAFIIYRPDEAHAAEYGHVIARSCAAAEAWVRAGLRAGQEVQFGRCEPSAPVPQASASR